MSFFGLSIAGSALAAFQEAENVASDDISNVNTAGASRQDAIITPQAPVTGSPPGNPTNILNGTLGDGVIVSQIQRVHDNTYDALFRGASSSQNYYSVQMNQLQATQGTLSEPTGGINDTFTAFQTAVQQLQNGPADPSAREGVITSAGQLVSAVTNTGQAIITQQAQVIIQAQGIVKHVNTLIDQIAQLNGEIRSSTAAGNNPNTYQDERDNLIDQLSQYLSTQTSIQANGSTLVTVGGQALVNDTTAYHLAQPVIGTNSSGVPTLKIGFVFDPNPLNPNAIPLGQGQLAGLVDLYNNKLSPYLNTLNSFTSGLATEVDRVTTSSYDQNGVAGLGLFQPIVGSLAISSTNIKVGISQATQVTAALASTQNGTIINPVNSANLTVDTSSSIINNPALQNSPAALIAGTLTVNVDGINENLTYSTTPGAAQIDASTIDNFISTFNAQQIGVTASYDSTAQKVVFSRDSNNESQAFRAQDGYAPTPSFTISDSNVPTPAAAGLSGSILGVLGAAGLAGVPNSVIGATVQAGVTSVTVGNPTGFLAGQVVQLGQGGTAEALTIASVQGNVINFTAATVNAHVSGDELTFNGAVVPIQQNATNAFGSQDNSAAVALSAMFSNSVGVPGLSTYVSTFNGGAGFAAPVGQSVVTIAEQVAGPLAQFGQINVGQALDSLLLHERARPQHATRDG